MKISRIPALVVIFVTVLFGCSNNNSPGEINLDIDSPVTEPNPEPEPETVKKVLLLGIDGLMYAYIDEVDDPQLNEPETPNFARLTIIPALTGGYFQTSTLQATSSGPGWASILSGTWVDRHDVGSNNQQPLAVPSLFALLDQRDPTVDSGSFAVWLALNFAHFAPEMTLVERAVSIADRKDFTVGFDDFMSEEVVAELDNVQSTLGFIFVHLDDMDAAGHNCGWCTGYELALKLTDARVGRILDAVERRERDLNEEWLVILTSDHGHIQPGGHGDQSLVERTSLIGVNRPDLMNAFFHKGSAPLHLTDDDAQNALMGQPGVVSIAPTVLEFLGYPAVREDRFAGASLLSAPGVYRLVTTVQLADDFSSARITLDWLNGEEVKRVRVYRNNELLVQLGPDTHSYSETVVLAESGAGSYHYEYSVEADIGTSLASQATFLLGEQPGREVVEEDAVLQVAFDDALPPMVWMPGTSVQPVFAAGSTQGDRSLVLNRDFGYASWNKSLADTPAFSVGLRVRITGDVESDPNLLSNKDWRGGSNPGFTLALTDDAILLNIGDGSSREDTSSIRYSKDQWLYVVAVIDTVQKSMSLFVSDPVLGLDKRMQSTGGVTSLVSGYPINLGEGGDGSYNIGRHFAAEVSELIVFDRALNELEVRALAQ